VTDRYTEVAIIGGGAAGIAAGRRLADACGDCLIVEARRRLGGRAWTTGVATFAAKSRAVLHVAPDELGPLAAGDDPYERNNLWMLQTAMRFGAEKVDFICLWNGKGGDGPGGTQHLMREVRCRAGRIHWLNTNHLWH
jgi:monoamine oxidase